MIFAKEWSWEKIKKKNFKLFVNILHIDQKMTNFFFSMK